VTCKALGRAFSHSAPPPYPCNDNSNNNNAMTAEYAQHGGSDIASAPLLAEASSHGHVHHHHPMQTYTHTHTNANAPLLLNRGPRAIGRGVSCVYNNIVGLFRPQPVDGGYTLLPSDASAHTPETGMSNEMIVLRQARPTQLTVTPQSYYTPTPVQAFAQPQPQQQQQQQQGPTVFIPANSVGTVNLL
jgi:hypothetical protein